jgi:hypothetical protein
VTDAEIPLLRLGDPASPVPAPVADLLLAHIANRDNMNAATNPAGSSQAAESASRPARIICPRF